MSVAISGATVIVGVQHDDDNGNDSGSAYLFDAATGQQIAKLLPTDSEAGTLFGSSVGISGPAGQEIAIVGSGWDNDNGTHSGSAYLFDTTTRQQISKLLAVDGAASDEFGFAVSISGPTAVVGAPLDDDNGAGSGSAYVFDAGSSTVTPATLTDVARTLGLYVSGGVPELLDSDDTYYVLQSGPGFDPSEPHPARADFGFDTGGSAASTLDITLEEKANIGGPTAVVLIRNWNTGQWDELSRFALSPSDQTFEVTGTAAGDYINGSSRIEVRVRTFAILVLNPSIRGIFSHDFVGVQMHE